MRLLSAILLAFLTASMALCADSFDTELRRGLTALKNNDLAAARKSLELASKLRPGSAPAWVALAQVYLRSNERQKAGDAARRAERLAPGEPVIQHALAMIYSEQGEFARAAEWERRFALSRPSDPDAATRAAELSMQAGDVEQTIAWSATALRLRESAESHHLLGAAYAASKRPDDAIPEFRKAVEIEPSSETFVFDLGRLQLERGDFAGASATFGEARRRFPASAQMQLAYGVAAYGQRQFDEAIDAFLRVVRIDPAVEQPYVFLGRILDNAGGRLPEVTQALAAYHDRNPQSAQASVLYAQALAAQLEPQGFSPLAEQAFALTQAALQQRPDDAEAHYLAGCLLERKQDYPSALAELRKAIAANPGQAAAHFHLARVYERLGRKEEAERERDLHQKLTSEAEQPDVRRGVDLRVPSSPAGKPAKE